MSEKIRFLDAVVSYQSRGVGVDMVLKSILGVFRLLMLYSKKSKDKAKYFKIVDSIIECRMLCNFGKPGITLYQGIHKYNAHLKEEKAQELSSSAGNQCNSVCSTGPNTNHCTLCEKIFLGSSLFRTLEQLSGDLGFLQKVVMHQWSREKLSFCYRFFKSFSLTLALIGELIHHARLSQQFRSHRCEDGECYHMGTVKRELLVSRSLIVRTLCDMYVYYKWLPFYTPNTTAEYICGSISGLIGVWLVWKDHRYPKGYIPPCPCGGLAKPQ